MALSQAGEFSKQLRHLQSEVQLGDSNLYCSTAVSPRVPYTVECKKSYVM